jgi:hypothetical protein
MKRFRWFCMICFLSGFTVVACQRNDGVHAANGSDTYQPRAAAKVHHDDHQMEGELIRVDKAGKTIGIRVENGMLQTFNVDNNTTVAGLASPPDHNVLNLIGKEGSEVIVQFDDQDGTKIARNIEVTLISASKSARHRR